jgi:threonine/homoserine/homoserine lactone efflux protein
MDILPPLPLLGAFMAASLVLAVTPGPGVLFIVAQSLAHGRQSAFAAVAGVALGNLGSALGAAFGLAALFAWSSLAFTLVKWAGAAYLVWLGVEALRGARSSPEHFDPAPPRSARTCRDAFVVALLNPKTTLFFAAFLPQFVSAGGASVVAQTLALGALFVAIAAATDSLYALTATSARALVSRSPRTRGIGRLASGGTLIGLGCLAALGERRR